MKAVTRRQFTKLAGITSFATSVCALPELLFGSDTAISAEAISQDPRRPQFHLLPPRNWMNDPNGPIYFQGKYHMFYQYNPFGAVWGNMSWNHAVSDDMLHWKHYPVAMTPSPDGADAAGCFSGSALVAEYQGRSRVCVIYTGVVHDLKHETIRNEGLRESQCLAWSDDPLLRHWNKRSEPLLPHPPEGLSITGFRDPAVWKDRDTYFLIVGSGISKVGGCVLLYESKDLLNWQYLHPLVSGVWDGKPVSNPVGDGEMWECPDFFPLGNAHVLIYSTMGRVFWCSGRFNRQTLKFETQKSGLLDIDAFYAPKTQLDAHGRRILWGWIPERRSKEEMTTAGWSGMMSLPRVLTLDEDGALRMEILPQTAELREAELHTKFEANESILNLPNASGEVICEASNNSDRTFLVLMQSKEILRITYSQQKHAWLMGEQTFALEPSDQPSVHAFFDGSVAELILGKRIGYTMRFYYPGPVAPDLTVRWSGPNATMKAWKIRPISSNRLTSEPMA